MQAGEHSSVEDSRATMEVFKLVRVEWKEAILDAREQREAQRKKKAKRDGDSSTTGTNTTCSSSSNSDDDDSYLSDAFWPDDFER